MKAYYRFGKRTVRQDMILSVVDLDQPVHSQDGRILTHVVNIDPICVDDPKFTRLWCEKADVERFLADVDKDPEIAVPVRKGAKRAR